MRWRRSVRGDTLDPEEVALPRRQDPSSDEPESSIGDDAPSLRLLTGVRYRHLDYAGQGSLGTVYRAFDAELGSTVALKTILDVGPDWIYRLKREFRTLRGVVHRNLAQLYDLVVSEDVCFFTMEFVDGPNFVEFVRGSSGDPPLTGVIERLLGAAPQLVEGVRALHAAGHLHRDIKPSNLKVDHEGRVVLLDFDLVAPVERTLPMDFASAGLAGTFAYMAPEQMLGLTIGPAADWYAVGGVLYESLTGELPIDERDPAWPSVIGQRRIVPVRQRIPEAPAWLSELIEALLSATSDERPTGEELIECFAAARAPARPGERRNTGRRPLALVGRGAELEQLEQLRREDGVAVVGVHGTSGVGKTELLRTFLAHAAPPGEAGPVVLAGRCNPQEAVPYKALDPIIDALSRHLVEHEAAMPSLDSQRAAALLKLFPVLARVPKIAGAARGGEVPDVIEARRLGTGALRELLGSLAERDGLIVWIDDVQWSDVDSSALLGEVLRPPATPPLLLLLSYRSEDRSNIPILAVLQQLQTQFPELTPRELELEPLAPEQAVRLASELCGSIPLVGEQLDAIVNGAQGSPFLIQEMVRLVQSRSPHSADATIPLDLSNVVSDRLGELGPEERRLLELVSLCGQPTEQGLILRAAGVGSRGWPLLARLEGRSLVRVHVASGEHAVQTYHDRIREAISRELPAQTRVGHHRELAEVFEASGRMEPDALAHHFHGAGQLARASDYGLAAADKASNALAFTRAAELYRSAREWDPRSPERERRLRTREGECTANASHLVEAGRLYLAAAKNAPRRDALELRRRASEHLLAGGSVEEGTAALASLLDDLGLRYPRSLRRAVLGSLGELAAILLRDFAPRGRKDIDPEEAIRIDTCFGIGKTLVDMDAMRGTYFSILGLARALKSGDRYRTARSLGVVGGLLSLLSGPLASRGRNMMQVARELAEELGAPELLGTLAVAEGQVLMLHGHWVRARERSSEGVRLLSERCQGFAHERNIGRGNVLRSLEEIGEDASEISELAQQLYEAATSASNLYAETAAVQHLSFAAMARGELDGARRLARRGVELWDRGGFHVQHLYTSRAEALCDLYEGRPRASHERLRELWTALRRSNLLRVPLVRADFYFLRGQLTLALARTDVGARDELLRSCEADARRLAREGRFDSGAHACLLRAGAHEVRRRPDLALPLLDQAIAFCDVGGMVLRGACARLRKGEILGGDAGTAFVDAASARIAKSGIAEPGRWAAMYALAFDRSEPARAA